MYVKTLSYRNFKGHSAAFELAPVTLIAGSNFAHKTSIPMAIRLGLAGYLPPPLGVRSVYALAGNPEGAGEMEIMLVMDNGRKVPWKWRKDEKGKVSTEGGLSADIAMPELMLDPRLFFAKTQAEQVQTIFNVCSLEPNEFGPAHIRARFGEVEALPVEVAEQTLEEISQRMTTMGHGEGSIQAWITGLVDYLKLNAKMAGDASKEASGSMKAFRATEPREMAADAVVFPKDVSSELQAVRDELMALKVDSNTSAMEARLQWLKLQQLGHREDYAAKIAELETSLAQSPLAEDQDADEIMEELTIKQGDRHTASIVAGGKVETLKKQYAAIEAAEVCPTCQNKRKGWKADTLKALAEQIADAATEREAAGKAAVEAKEKMTAIRQWVNAGIDLEDARKAQAAKAKVEQQITEVEGQIAAATNPEATAKAQALQSRLAELEQQQRAWDVHQQDRTRKQAIGQQIALNDCRQEVFKTVLKIAQEEQGKLINKAFGKVLNVARHFTDGLLNSPLEFVDGKLGRKVSQADRMMGCQAPMGSWISFDTFSGTEELLALAGFGVALTNGAAVKLVILDELGRLDHKRKLAVTERMGKLTASGVIDQAILIDVVPGPYAGLTGMPGFRVITL